jgi:hypothetical protein
MALHPSSKLVVFQHENHHASLPRATCSRWCHPMVLFSNSLCQYHYRKSDCGLLFTQRNQVTTFTFRKQHIEIYKRHPTLCPHILKAKKEPSFQHFLHVFHNAMDAPNEEFPVLIIHLYTD